MTTSNLVILGGGMVAGYTAKRLVELGLKPGRLTILSADTAIPYERPPLSKGFLAGRDTEESIRINAAGFYRDHGIEVKLGREISGIDPERKLLFFKSGGEIGFNKLLVATGAKPRVLGIPGATLQNLFYLRSMTDSAAIRSAAAWAKHALVIGGGFIGMEVASVLAEKNIEVTMVLNEDRIWKKLFAPEMSGFFESYYRSHAVRIVKASSVTELRGDGTVRSAVLRDGESLACDLVVAGIGVKPATEMLAGGGLDIDDGVTVNEYLETSRPGIFAAGDVANFFDVIFRKHRRLEHWDNAVSQGQHCAQLLMGDRLPFKHVPYFFSDVFDLSYEYWGDTSGADTVIHRGDPSSRSFSTWWLRNGRLIAAFAMNRPDEERDVSPKWIETGQPVSPAVLKNASRPISEAAGPDHDATEIVA